MIAARSRRHQRRSARHQERAGNSLGWPHTAHGWRHKRASLAVRRGNGYPFFLFKLFASFQMSWNETDLNSARRDASNGTLLMRGGLLEVAPRLGPSTGVWRLQRAFFGAGPSAVLLGPARAVRVQAAATRRERTRRPNFRCMIGPYDPAG